jgi:hypothetical protein
MGETCTKFAGRRVYPGTQTMPAGHFHAAEEAFVGGLGGHLHAATAIMQATELMPTVEYRSTPKMILDRC